MSALKLNSTGVGSLQTGFDYKIRDHWYANMDVKWVVLGTDLYLPGPGQDIDAAHRSVAVRRRFWLPVWRTSLSRDPWRTRELHLAEPDRAAAGECSFSVTKPPLVAADRSYGR